MRPLILLLLLSVAPAAAMANQWLTALDRALDAYPERIAARKAELDSMRAAELGALSPRERFDAEMALQNAYKSYSLDSALLHIKQAIYIADTLDDRPAEADAQMALAGLYTTSGVMYKEAWDIFRSIDRPSLEPRQLPDYYNLGIQIYRNLAAHSLDNELQAAYLARKVAYRDSLLMLDPQNAVLLANRYMDSGELNKAIDILKQNTPDGLTTREAAITYNILAQAYGLQGNRQMEEAYLAQSAACDLLNGVREYLSLQTLAMRLYEDGDYDRAYRYIHRSITDATDCNAKLRMLEMSEILPVIDTAYNDTQRKARRTALIGSSIIVALLIALLLAWVKVRKKNRTLASSNAELTALHERLLQSNRIKEEYITQFMNLCLDYLAKMERYRVELNKSASRGEMDKLIEMIRSTRYVNQEIAEFYGKFDAAFLQLFPSFVDELNALLRPECCVRAKNPGELNTELRVIALYRLGISDIDSVCKFLRCSSSTVYNYRAKLKGCAINRDTFETDVMAICK